MNTQLKALSKAQLRKREVAWLGKDLTRRSKSSCELCGADHTKLYIYEVRPIPKVPTIHHCLFVCHICNEQLHNRAKLDSHHWQCLHTAAWSIIPAIQVTAVDILKRLENEEWARILLEQIYMPPEVKAWLERM